MYILAFMQSTHYSCLIFKNLNSLKGFLKNTQISNFMKICPVEVELFHVDKRSDMMKLIVVFRSLVSATRRCIIQLRRTLVLLILAVYESFFVFQQTIEFF